MPVEHEIQRSQATQLIQAVERKQNKKLENIQHTPLNHGKLWDSKDHKILTF